MAEPQFAVIAGAAPLILVAPHGGRRDAARRPWREGGLKVNDLHTAALTERLAAATGAAALVNVALDRNDTDLNRIGEAAARAPRFLELLATLVAEKVAAHGRVTLLTVHGWNVVQAALDVGLGCPAAADPLAVDGRAAVSPRFAATALAALLASCARRGIGATVGARYPARHPENLLQLFTPRHRDDLRPPVRALAALAPRVDAMQLELGIPLRWPGAWRERLCEAVVESFPALLDPPAAARARPPAPPPAAAPASCRLEFTSAALCGLAALDGGPGGGRLLLFLPGGRLLLFTGERAGGASGGGVAPLALRASADGASVRFRGPLLAFPDSTPFLDLEAGLARGRLVDADVALDWAPDALLGGDGFGRVAGHVRLDGSPIPLDGLGVAGGSVVDGAPPPRLRVALRLAADCALQASVSLRDGTSTGALLRGRARRPVHRARATLGGPRDAPLARLALDVELDDGERLALTAHAVHTLPVIRLRGARPLRLEFAACRLDGQAAPAGWCDLVRLEP